MGRIKEREIQDSEVQELVDSLDEFGLALVHADVGTGGSAWVHQARVERSSGRLPAIGSEVAVKQYKPELLAQDGQLRRVQQEADLGATLDSPNIVKTYGLFPNNANPKFLVMEWIDGKTLADWNKSPTTIEWSALQAIALNLVNGLESMHRKGVMHRDLKPENVMIRADDTAVIMDIGIAELTVETAESLHTNVGYFLGSMRYASLQHLMGEKFDASDDVYGLGTIFFELFTGRTMFEGQDRKPVLPILISQEGQRVESLRESIPAPIRVLVQSAIHRDRSRRPSLADIRTSLEDPAGSQFITAELERQTSEERGFLVLKTFDSGMSFLADLGGMDLDIGRQFRVVRRSEPITVPSLARKVSPEQWIGTAVLQHVFQNVGHFILTGKRWEAEKNSIKALMGVSDAGGRWIEHEQVATSVKAGDWVLKDRR